MRSLGVMRWPAWLGVGERRWKRSPDEEVQPSKTAWDVLQLLIVPLMLVLIAFYFNASQASRDRSREDRRSEDATLDAYLAKMSDLMLDRDLLTSRPESPVREVARAETLNSSPAKRNAKGRGRALPRRGGTAQCAAP